MFHAAVCTPHRRTCHTLPRPPTWSAQRGYERAGRCRPADDFQGEPFAGQRRYCIHFKVNKSIHFKVHLVAKAVPIPVCAKALSVKRDSNPKTLVKSKLTLVQFCYAVVHFVVVVWFGFCLFVVGFFCVCLFWSCNLFCSSTLSSLQSGEMRYICIIIIIIIVI